MASEGSERKDGSKANVTTWWVVAHPKYGFCHGIGADGGEMLRLYEELDSELLHDVKEANEDYQDQRWKAVRVSIEVLD